MTVGGRDTGKTTVTQPAALIFNCMETPQADSFCPLEGIRGYEVFLWQDFRYNPGHPHKEEQGLRLDEGTWNRFLEGLPTRIGVPKTDGSRADFVYKEDASCIFTRPFKMTAYRNGFPDTVETEQLEARVKYIEFARPAPEHRDRSFKHCPLCWSQWILEGELAWHRTHHVALDEFMEKVVVAMSASRGGIIEQPSGDVAVHGAPQGMVGSSTGPALQQQPANNEEFMNQLRALIEWRSQGWLNNDEFNAAKRKLGLSSA